MSSELVTIFEKKVSDLLPDPIFLKNVTLTGLYLKSKKEMQITAYNKIQKTIIENNCNETNDINDIENDYYYELQKLVSDFIYSF